MFASSVNEFKLFSAALIWTLALVGGFGPLLLRRFSNNNNTNNNNKALLTSVLNMFAGGVFLAGACLHLLPDAQANQALTSWLCESRTGCFQWANCFFGLGFLLVLFVDVLAHTLQHRMGAAHGRHTQESHELTPLLLTSDQIQIQHLQQQLSIRDHHRHHESCSSQDTDASVSPQATSYDITNDQHGHSHHHDVEAGSHSEEHQWRNEPMASSFYGTSTTTTAARLANQQPKAAVNPAAPPTHTHGLMTDQAKPLLACVVFLALSFHSVMEGMGIGASDHAAWDILVAVLAHKSLAAFALTQELLAHHSDRSSVLSSIGAFSAMTPAGILLGWLLVDSTTSTTDHMASGVCSALAGGTFLFVATVEVIPHELRDQHALGPKCAALLAGFGAMGVLSIWT